MPADARTEEDLYAAPLAHRDLAVFGERRIGDLIGGHQLRQASMASFGYAVLCLIEGTGLVMRKVWAEYFTVVLTALAMPWEGYEVLEHYTVFKLGLLLLNLAVLLYLLWVLKKKKLVTV